ncbi:SMP-30/gluconolactonase/LRE family protein [Reichenbachiella carrageenanivorans]|uniref:SMP-30/gluconolactonase/LRE family protein n=1 Tax=Reichenbachiella carrageenanivorans TaxID=2979869 RepID=A0ABY6CV15_9BACT|nr:SMP-30/gluconolactonase/LRE family protein [Reichenbachiella carrageenanivorans]UXX77766.1 SMP-30/gluconolactonase/LRE family protein [Reichenbachiella carrageenanivorans]
MRKIFSPFFISIVLFSCTSKPIALFEASDWAYVGEYSLGLEGPAVDIEGNLFFVNPQKNGTIGRLLPTGQFDLYIDSLPQGSVANGIRFGNDGLMYLADYVNHNILTIDPVHREVVVFAHDSTMNQPNDLAISERGVLFASDPNWVDSTGNLWRVELDGKFVKLADNMGTTNGIEVAPGDRFLYVNESAQRKIWAFDLSPEGEISNKRLLIQFADHGLDGMRCDTAGNLYVARYGKGVIAVISPAGELLQEVELKGLKPTNIAFGGLDGRTCYVTCQDRGYIETFHSEYPGRSWALRP